MRRISQADASAELAWLRARVSGGGFAGFDVGGWEATIWILHAMYENTMLPAGVTYEEERRIQEAAGMTNPDAAEGTPIGDILKDATLTGGGLGWSASPGAGWERLRWRELADRLGVDPFAIDFPPCYKSFPYRSWPVSIVPPSEGSLDWEQFVRLAELLGSVNGDAEESACFAYYSPLATGEFDEETETVFAGSRSALPDLYNEDTSGSPSNIWPEDRSWFVYTDWDLWATKVSGSRDLTDRIRQDKQLEAVRLDF
jgi:hypothetical protein